MIEQPRAEPLDVSEVVCGQQHRDAPLAVDFAQELAHRRFRDDVEPDRGLVEEDDLRIVEQRGGELAAHPLAERELAHGRLEERPEREHVGEAVEVLAVPGGRHAVDVAKQLERVAQRQVPPELRALAEHDADLRGELDRADGTDRGRRRGCGRRSARGFRSASSRSSTCRRRSGRGSRRSCRARSRTRSRRRRRPRGARGAGGRASPARRSASRPPRPRSPDQPPALR